MIPQDRRHPEITAMGQMVVARVAQPRPVKIGIPAQLPMMGRVMDEDVLQVAGVAFPITKSILGRLKK